MGRCAYQFGIHLTLVHVIAVTLALLALKLILARQLLLGRALRIILFVNIWKEDRLL